MNWWVKAAASMLLLAAESAWAAGSYVLLEPVRDASGRPLTQASAGGASLPVLKRAETGETSSAAQRVLSSGFASQIPALDLAARNAAELKPSCPGLPQAVYILLSEEDGGYARQGFYIADAGRTTLCEDHYIDLTADTGSIASGEFEEVLAHEWGHVLLRRLLGPVPATPSRKFHSVRTVTDQTTAFDEGFGIHLQPLSAKLSQTPGYRARIDGATPPRIADFWFSRQETWMRQVLVPANQLVFEKEQPSKGADAYHAWMADEAASNFDSCRLKSGDQMVAAEGVVASFFHRLLGADPASAPEQYRKAIAVLARMGTWPKEQPAVIAFVQSWGSEFPAETTAVTKLFLDVTHGASASSTARDLTEQAACAGASGDIEAFLAARKAAQEARGKIDADVAAGRLDIGAALGPQLWIANPATKIPAAPWQGRRDLPAIADINTAREAELELIFAGTPLAGAAAKMVAARRSGPYTSFEDAATRAPLDRAGLKQLLAARDQVRSIGTAVRR
jgi:hypothetical protein